MTIRCAIEAAPYPPTQRSIAPSKLLVNDYRSVKTMQRARRHRGGHRERDIYMSEVHRVAVEIGGTEIAFETGKMAKQASGAVTVTAGDTVVLSTATAGNLRDVDFLPLTVDVEERMYAAGKIPGSFFKREGRAGEKATLIARMIDRPLR